MVSIIYRLVGFGAFGYVLKMYGFQVGPVILGPIMEDNYRRAMQDVQHSVPLFFSKFISNPLMLALIIIAIAMVGGQVGWWDKIRNSLFRTK
jgi:putative tricarboxylic transport membrane protein